MSLEGPATQEVALAPAVLRKPALEQADLGRDRLRDDLAVEELDGAVGVGDEARVVRDHADGGAGAVQQAATVQSAAAMLMHAEERLAQQQQLADRIYERWLVPAR